jgi:transposase
MMMKMLREGIPIAEIARRIGVTRQTIYNWKKSVEGGKPERSIRKRKSKLDPYREHIAARLERFDLPAAVLLREIREKGYTGGITILRELVAAIKAVHVQRVVDRFETEPGRQAQVDFAHCGAIRHQGRRASLSLIVVVLGYSRTIWAKFLVTQRQDALMESLEEAFGAFGGVPRELLFDNLKQVVATPRTEDEAVVFQPSFLAFAEHWGFETVACPVYWPRAKGKVERSIQYVKRSFLEGRTFKDLDDLNAQLRVWLAEVANVRIQGTTKVRPVERMEEEREAMLPLGTKAAYPSTTVEGRLVDHDSRISFRGVRYSVDPSILTGRRGEAVEVHVGTDHRIRIFHHGKLVGEHAIQPKTSSPVDDPRHAALRRKLRQMPHLKRPHGKNPRYEQMSDEEESAVSLPSPPHVQEPDLAAYEGRV